MTAIPVDFYFWATYVAYCVHVIEESLMGGGFVKMVQKDYWPKYNWTRFAWFNTGIFALYALSILLYEYAGHAFLILPLSFACFFATNGLWHFYKTITKKRYAPGVITGQIYLIILFLLFQNAVITGSVPLADFESAAVIGFIVHTAMIASFHVAPRFFPK